MEKIKMQRDLFVAALMNAARTLAVRRGYLDVEEKEDRRKGIWGESLTRMIEQSAGQCTKQVKYSDDLAVDNGHRKKVEFDFRFANPRIYVSEDGVGCAVEFSDQVLGEGNKNSHTEEWYIAEMQIFREAGLKLYEEIKEAVCCAVCEITCETNTISA